MDQPLQGMEYPGPVCRARVMHPGPACSRQLVPALPFLLPQFWILLPAYFFCFAHPLMIWLGAQYLLFSPHQPLLPSPHTEPVPGPQVLPLRYPATLFFRPHLASSSPANCLLQKPTFIVIRLAGTCTGLASPCLGDVLAPGFQDTLMALSSHCHILLPPLAL